MTSPPGLCDSDPVPETATRSRERRRVALVIREITACFQERFDRLKAKLDMATNGLVLVANQELAKLNSADTKPEGDQSTSIPSTQYHDVCDKHGMDHKALCLDMTDNNKFCHTASTATHPIGQTSARIPQVPFEQFAISDDRVDIGVQVDCEDSSSMKLEQSTQTTESMVRPTHIDIGIQATVVEDLSTQGAFN